MEEKAHPTRFKAGQSGNPNGRPKKTAEQIELEAMCRAKTPEALETIMTIMQTGENERNRLSAAEYIIDRGWGKATQNIAANVDITIEELLSSVIKR